MNRHTVLFVGIIAVVLLDTIAPGKMSAPTKVDVRLAERAAVADTAASFDKAVLSPDAGRE
jgi:hypothetical protein